MVFHIPYLAWGSFSQMVEFVPRAAPRSTLTQIGLSLPPAKAELEQRRRQYHQEQAEAQAAAQARQREAEERARQEVEAQPGSCT